MSKKYSTGADVLRALADGRKVIHRPSGLTLVYSDDAVRVLPNGRPYEGRFHGDWEIVEEPATDAELVAEMRRRATSPGSWQAWAEAANMLEKRSVKP